MPWARCREQFLHFRCVCGHEFSVYLFIAEHNYCAPQKFSRCTESPILKNHLGEVWIGISSLARRSGFPLINNHFDSGCADRMSGSSEFAVAPKSTHPVTEFSQRHYSLGSSCSPFQTVFVMESSQNRLGHHMMIDRNLVSAGFALLGAGLRIGNARSEAGMWTADRKSVV